MKEKEIVKKKETRKISLIETILVILIILVAVPVIAIIASGGGYEVKQFFTGSAGQTAEGGGYGMRFLATPFQPGDSNAAGGGYSVNIGSFSSSDNQPQITQVQPVSAITLTSFSITNVNVLFDVTDADGFGDLNDSLAFCSLSKSGEATRNSTSCTAQDQSGNDLTYNCSLDMSFYDSSGFWNITCFAEDINGNSATNDTETATVNALNHVTQNFLSIDWSSLTPGNNNEEAQSSLVFANGGNKNYTIFNISSQNATFGSNVIPNNQFKVDNETSQSSGQTSLNDFGIIWPDGSLPKCVVPCSSNSTEEAYFYVDTPTGILGGVYASIANWTISIS